MCIVCLKRRKINGKGAEDDPFQKIIVIPFWCLQFMTRSIKSFVECLKVAKSQHEAL